MVLGYDGFGCWALIAPAQTEILCGRCMAGLKELRQTMLSFALKHSAVDLKGASVRTKCRVTMREERAMWLHAGSHTGALLAHRPALRDLDT